MIVAPVSSTIANFRGDLVREMVSLGHRVVAVGPEPGFEKEVGELGARFICLPMRKTSTGITHDLKYFRRLFRIMRREKPDLVLGYAIKPVIYGSLAAKLAGVKEIYALVTGLGYIYTTRSPKTKVLKMIAGPLYRLAFTCADRVIFQNRDDRREFVRAGYLPEARCALVDGSGVNMERFPGRPLPEGISFLMIARLLRNKGVIEYLEAAARVRREHPGAVFVLLGALERIQDSIAPGELSPYTEGGVVRRFPETRDVRPFLAGCSVFVLPSYREGVPRTVLEAMATGRPVITTDVPGCRETVVDGVNGFLVPPRDPGALAGAMAWFLENPGQAAVMGAKSRELCRARFEVGRVNGRMLEIMRLPARSSATSSRACKGK